MRSAALVDRNGVQGHTSTRSAQWKEGHKLRKNALALVYGSPLRVDAKDHNSGVRRSNRDQTQTPNSARKLVTYGALMGER
jgi:hypothetical protein